MLVPYMCVVCSLKCWVVLLVWVGFAVTGKHNLIFACLCYDGYWYLFDVLRVRIKCAHMGYWTVPGWGCLFCWLVVALVGFGLTNMGPLLHDPGTLVQIGTSEAGLLVAACSSLYFACLWVVFACLYMLSVVGDPENYMTL
jgi:hypothetical protein